MIFKPKMLARIFSLGKSQSGSSSPAPTASDEGNKRKHIIRALESFLIDRKPLSEIRDESELPYPKPLLLNAISLEILHEDDDGRIEYLKIAAACLVDFQKGVGSTPVTLLGVSDADTLSADTLKLAGPQDPITRIKLNPHLEKYRTLRNTAERELQHILRRLSAIATLRNKTTPLQPDF